MKVLYAIQGTGNGHLSRAMVIAPELMKKAKVDYLISGKASEVAFPYPFKYKYHGLYFHFGDDGGPAIFRSIRSLKPLAFLRDVWHCPVKNYDLVINDFEPVSAWAAKLRKVPCVALSHQASFKSPKVGRPLKQSRFWEWGLRIFAPAGKSVGIHYDSYDIDMFPPVIRKEVLEAVPAEDNYIVVYLPAFSDEILARYFSEFPDENWRIFSKKTKEPYSIRNIMVQPVNQETYTHAIIRAKAMVLGAGFQATAEALYLGKKIMAVPMRMQYEQACNAAALEHLGVTVVHYDESGFLNDIRKWLISGTATRKGKSADLGQLVETVLDMDDTGPF